MNELYGDIPLMSNEWASLKGLSIKYNQLNGTSLEGLCMMKNLEELDISFNNLNSDIPDCFRYLSSLNYFDISHNQLEMRFPSSIFENLTRLEYAAFSDNNFNGVLSVSSFANNAELKLLDLSNNYQLELETEDLVSPPSFQLEGIVLANCIVNKVSQSIPTFLFSQYMVEYIDLSSNNLKGNIPLWLLENKTNLTNLNLRDNSLTGSLILPSQSTNLELFDVSNNKLTGEIPLSIGTIFPNLWYLSMSNNLLHGVIPPSVKNLSDLEYFGLSDNNLSGQFSNLLKELPNLYILDLSMNQFQGTLTPNNMTQFSLPCFLVNNNQLSGEIPTSLCDNSMLSFLDISENHFFGNLPSCIADISQLSVLNAAGNNLEGNLPDELCYMNQLESMDLSKNHFFGQVPSCFNMTHLEYLNLRDNELTGPFPNALSNLPLVTLDLGNNNFFGHIPSWIGTTLKFLKILSLKGNHFDGPISMQICNLRFLHILDLSHNNLSGHIPSCLHNIGHNSNLNYQFTRTTQPQGGYNTGLFPRNYITNVFFTSPEMLQAIIPEYIEFATKQRSDRYRGNILKNLSGLDLSCNQLTGMIPENMGQMTWLQALNLSNNRLTGPIPATLSILREIESLDLSHNMLVGRIPPQLAKLNYLEVFSVAYNNLSGPTIGLVAQFSTFNESSYEGNPYLCGPPLKKNCTSMTPSSPKQQGQLTNDIHDDNEEAKDRLILFASIALGFISGFWGWMALLFFKRNLRYSFFLAMDGYTEEALDMVKSLLSKMKSCWW
ncbi:Non-specific serine/threonine protein kinase protein [Dioscorea alata]|uniref:Non-specific serine/threonine protein kinase protein n=1 Tax=Dioscorea alata TaxID=55571 RepID=A0ACB7WK68_DIOAL|nr:Non-specific serine/threonine protein kinase protein [Dioscorea alata]